MSDGTDFSSNERIEIGLSEPQYKLIASTAKFPAFVGGFGSGKTHALINRALMLKGAYPTGNIGYYLPTYDLVSMIALPRFEEKLEELKYIDNSISFKVIKSPRPAIKIENCGDFIFRTMDNPNRIVGYETMDSLIDEIDILKEEEAKNAWRKILARNRQKKPDHKKNTIAVGTTPEGYKFVYNTWGKDQVAARIKGYQLIKASTYSNQHNLPFDYIKSLTEAYPSNLIQAYIEGEFVNLTSGSVYPEFDRIANGSNETILPGEDLYIGLDFNVTKMAAVVFVQRNGWPHAVAELTGIFDTPAMTKALKARFPNNRCFIYPDASGAARKSQNASVSDIALLKSAGFHVYHNHSNPAVKDRVLAINVMIKNADGIRRFFVNVNTCPMFVEGLEKQAYDKNGEPDKTSGLDHCLDAGGYFVSYVFPVRTRGINRMQMVGI